MNEENALSTEPWSDSHDPLTMPLAIRLHRAQAKALEIGRPVCQRYGLTFAEFDVLATLRNAPPPHERTPSALQAALVITSGGLTKVMAQLEARGLVIRSRPGGDQRIKPVALSDAGKTLVESAMADMAAATSAWLRSRLAETDLARLSCLLGGLAENDPSG